MYLKKLNIMGFKSFGEAVELGFSRGVTAVVGPNGSGKSNVLDAIRWVLGELNAGALRGGRMTSLIFAGTEKKKPLGLAEVSITFDNSSGRLPLSFSEITITRRLDRSGASEYAINKIPCRLKDIWDLLTGTGLGPQGLAIIGQGKLDQVLTASHEERRGFLEELAGIDRYKRRKREVLHRLDESDNYISRSEDSLREMQESLEALLHEAKRWEVASGYQRAEKELGILIRGYALQEANGKLQRAKDGAWEAQAKLSALEQGLAEGKEILSSRRGVLDELQEEEAKLNAGLTALERERNKAQNDVTTAAGRVSFWQGEGDRLRGEIQTLAERNVASLVRCREGEGALGSVNGELGSLSATIGQAEGEVTGLRLKAQVEGQRSKEMQDQLETLRGEVRSAQNQILLLSKEREFIWRQKESADGRRQNWEKEATRCAAEVGRAKRALTEGAEALAAVAKVLDRLEAGQKSLRDRAQRWEKVLGEKQRGLSKDLSRLGALRELEENLSGYNQGVRCVLEAAKGGALQDICGVVAGLIQVAKGHDRAIEVALGGTLQDVVTKNDVSAKAAVAYLKAKNGGRATFLPLNLIAERESSTIPDLGPGNLGWAKDLVKCDPLYKGIVAYLLGRVLVAEDLTTALRMGKATGHRYKIVTLEGDVLHSGGSITGGSWGERTGGLLRRRQEQEELMAKSSQVQGEVDGLSRRLGRLMAVLERIKSRMTASRGEKEGLSLELVRAEESTRAWEKRQEELAGEEERVRLETAEIYRREGELTVTEEGAKVAMAHCQAKCQEAEEGAAIFLAQCQEEGDLLEVAERHLTELKLKEAALRQQEATLAAAVAEATREAQRAKEDWGKRKESLQDLEAKMSGADDEREKASLLAVQATEQMASLEEMAGGLRRRTEEEKSWLRREEEKLKRREKALEDERKVIQANAQDVIRLETEVTFRRQGFQEAGGREEFLVELLAQGSVGSLREAQEQLGAVQEQLAAFGQVNPLAAEEYQRTNDRHAALGTEVEDLQAAKGELLRAVDVLDRRMSQRFWRTFQRVKENFAETCNELFGGGKADLSLSGDGQNPLEQNLEIMVQPPGKKYQGLDVLSGGERSLAAIAFLFSLAKTKMAPFYILDEVEAALDESNVANYNRFLRHYGDQGQFIVVTHQRQTMETADVLYGVTMEPGGSSKVLSMLITGKVS